MHKGEPPRHEDRRRRFERVSVAEDPRPIARATRSSERTAEPAMIVGNPPARDRRPMTVTHFSSPRRAAAIAVIGLLLGGCTAAAPGASGGATGDDLPDGLERVEVSDEGFSIGLPDDWDELSAEDLGESGIFEELESANPEAADVLAQAQQAIESGQIALFAFDAEPDDPESTFAANLNVISAGEVDGSAQDAADQMAEGVRAQVPVNGEVETETVTLPAGEAGVVRYEWTVAGGDGSSTDVSVTQYAVLAGGDGFILSFSAASDTMTEYAPLFEQVAESFEAG